MTHSYPAPQPGFTPAYPGEKPVYVYYVTIDHQGRGRLVYKGPDAAEAMAAWSRAVAAGNFYPVLEAILDRQRRIRYAGEGSRPTRGEERAA